MCPCRSSVPFTVTVSNQQLLRRTAERTSFTSGRALSNLPAGRTPAASAHFKIPQQTINVSAIKEYGQAAPCWKTHTHVGPHKPPPQEPFHEHLTAKATSSLSFATAAIKPLRILLLHKLLGSKML